MLLQKLELYNFRCFYGYHNLIFSQDDKNPVTVFHGENGAGKTNLLNAIHWCITGKFTPRFENQFVLVNRSAHEEGSRESHVELTFQYEGEIYRVRRAFDNGSKSLDVFNVKSGNSSIVTNPQGFLNKVVPEGLVSWFFFDAEAIGSLRLSGSEQFKDDLRRTLGFTLIDTLIIDLQECIQKKQRELTAQSNNRQLSDIQKELDGVAHVLPGQLTRKIELDRSISRLDDDLTEVIKRLNILPKATEYQTKRSKYQAQKNKLEATRKNYLRSVADMIGTAGPSIIINSLAKSYEDNLIVKEKEGRLPSPFGDRLVKDLLKDELCICGRPLHEGTHEREIISGLMKIASTSDLNRRIREIQWLITDIQLTTENFPKNISKIRSDISELDTEIGELEESIDEISKILSSIDDKEIRQLEEKQINLRGLIRKETEERGALSQVIKINQAKQKDLNLRYENESRKTQVQGKLKEHINKIDEVLKYVTNSLRTQEVRTLNIFTFELNKILGKYLTKSYRVKIDPSNYAVKLLDENGEIVPHSTGEQQVLKFAFISTVIALAARKTTEKIDWMVEPTIAPLVLDAPFSALDPQYQASVAKNLAAQTTQLVLMVSTAAWQKQVQDSLEQYIGKEYLIVSHSAGGQDYEGHMKPIKQIFINGVVHDLNKYNCDRDESVFQEIKL
jgi:DNA sulfur modification protein DndD